jgi:hypothetical protein
MDDVMGLQHTEEDEEGGDSFQARMEWCLDHQFELLHVPLAGDAPLQGEPRITL